MNHKIKYLNSYKQTVNLSKKPFDSKLTEFLPQKAGRNNRGSITVRRKGGGHKRRYRKIDFKFLNKNGKIVSLEYDPNRTAFLAGCEDRITTKKFYTLLPEGLSKGSFIGQKKTTDLLLKTGHFGMLKEFPLGTVVYGVESSPGRGSSISRSAGTFSKLIQKDFSKGLARIKLPSRKEVFVSLDCLAFAGVVSNSTHSLKVLSKAGRRRWLGIRPHVRGVAMNPVDHPHGGGEGKTSGGRPSTTPWGRLTRGQPTAKKE